MKNKKFKNIATCMLVTSMLLGGTVAYGQTEINNDVNNSVNNIEQMPDAVTSEKVQLQVKPGHEAVEMKVGQALDHDFLAQHVEWRNGGVLAEGYVYEPVFITGKSVFKDGIAQRSGKASIRVRVKDTEGDATMMTEACIQICIKEDCTTEPEPEPEDEYITHMPYIYGYEDGTFRADRGVSREELASMVSRLILQGGYPAYPNKFTDLSDNRYSANSIAHLDALGIMKGYGDGTFHPHEKITRGEMAAVIERTVETLGLDPMATSMLVNDMHQVRPDEPLTRAEAVITLNKVFSRVCDDVEISNPYSDLVSNYWAYADILYASVVHEHEVNK